MKILERLTNGGLFWGINAFAILIMTSIGFKTWQSGVLSVQVLILTLYINGLIIEKLFIKGEKK